MKLTLAVLTAIGALAALPVQAEIVVGVSLGITGPGASLGVHSRNAYQLMPKTLGNEPVRYIILDDASDPTNAAKNARKLISEDKADVLMGSNVVPSEVEMAQAAADAKIPMMVLTPANLAGNVLHWSFIVPQTTELMMGAIAQKLKANGVKTVGYIGYTDPGGDIVYSAIQSHAAESGFKIVNGQR